MTDRMRQVLHLAVVLASWGETLALQWLHLVWRGAVFPVAGALVVFAALCVANFVVLPRIRGHLHSGGLAQWLCLAWIFLSLAAIFVGIVLTLLGLLMVAGWYLLLGSGAATVALVWLGGAVLTAGFGSVLWGAGVGSQRVRVDRVSLPIPGAAEQLAGVRIAHITDLHIGPLLRQARLRGFVDRINRLEADVVVITGDIFDFDPAYVELGCRELSRLRARLGVFAVTGNHDVYTGVDVVAAGIARHTEIRLLRNAWELLEVGGAHLIIAGVDDPGLGWTEREARHPELEALHASIPPDLPSLLLSHRPSFFGHAAELGFSLVLAGHTHGGQVALPRAHHVNISRMISNHTRGVFRNGETTLYVNRGLGMAGLPFRLNCPREIALVELTV